MVLTPCAHVAVLLYVQVGADEVDEAPLRSICSL